MSLVTMFAPTGWTASNVQTLSGGIIAVANGEATVPSIAIAEMEAQGFVIAFGTKTNLTATQDPGVGNDNTQGYAVGSLWVNKSAGRAWICTDTTTGAAAWALSIVPGLGLEPSNNIEQFGSGTGAMLAEGNIFKLVSAGISPGTLNGDYILSTFNLPANSLDGTSNRELQITALGSFANNTNSKRVKIWAGGTGAAVGSLISGASLLCDTGVYNTAGAAQFQLQASLAKYGAANSNTQLAAGAQVVIGGAHSGAGAGASAVPQLLTLTENAAIPIVITGNAVTTLSDIVLNMFTINGMD
jgi:hypothetical protein